MMIDNMFGTTLWGSLEKEGLMTRSNSLNEKEQLAMSCSFFGLANLFR